MLQYIVEKDKELLIFLNSLGTTYWDSFWLLVTDKLTWIPLYLILLLLLFRFYGWKKALATLLIVALLITFSDQFVNFIKFSFQRLRPNNDPTINSVIRVVKNVGGYSFISGHATSSFAVASFFIASLRKYFKPIYLVLVWPILFMYSRIYLGVHYPIDVSLGLILGVIFGLTFYKLSLFVLSKINI